MVKVRDFLGPYRLARLIRLGSTCQVWEAILEQDQKRYALKVLRPDQRGNKEEIAFLKHEFEVAKELNHKNIIKLIEYRTNAETPFIVMELFSELNLKMALRRGPEPIAYQLTSIVDQACESLYYLHSKGSFLGEKTKSKAPVPTCPPNRSREITSILEATSTRWAA